MWKDKKWLAPPTVLKLRIWKRNKNAFCKIFCCPVESHILIHTVLLVRSKLKRSTTILYKGKQMGPWTISEWSIKFLSQLITALNIIIKCCITKPLRTCSYPLELEQLFAMLIYDESLLSGHHPLSGHLPVPWGWLLIEVQLYYCMINIPQWYTAL